MRTRILLVDDHTLVRQGLASVLRDSWDICGEAANGREAIEKVRELKPDVVLLDLSMPVMGGPAAAREIRHVSPATKIVFLSMHDSESILELAKLSGADAWLSKRCATEELNCAIAAVVRGIALTSADGDAFPGRKNMFVRIFDPT